MTVSPPTEPNEIHDLRGAVVLRSARTTRRPATTAGSTREDAKIRAALGTLYDATSRELRQRSASANLEPAGETPVSIQELSSISGELVRLTRQAPALAGRLATHLQNFDVAAAASGLQEWWAEAKALSDQHRRGDYDVDEFGFDPEWTELLLPFFRFLYQKYFRVQTIGVENIPADGNALLVANHAGVIAYDGAMVRVAAFDEHPAHRHVRPLVLNAFFSMPVASWVLRRSGNTLANPSDAEELLSRGELVLVFPEGAKGAGKLYRDRYQLRRFGRGGFVEVALRTKSPIIPVSIVGSEEIHPMMASFGPMASLLKFPYFPVTPTFPWLGPAGLIPLPSSWVIQFHEPIDTSAYGPHLAQDPSVVMKVSDQVRQVIQQGVFENLERRGSVFSGI